MSIKAAHEDPELIALRALWDEMKEDGIIGFDADAGDFHQFKENVIEIFRVVKK